MPGGLPHSYSRLHVTRNREPNSGTSPSNDPKSLTSPKTVSNRGLCRCTRKVQQSPTSCHPIAAAPRTPRWGTWCATASQKLRNRRRLLLFPLRLPLLLSSVTWTSGVYFADLDRRTELGFQLVFVQFNSLNVTSSISVNIT